MRNRLFLLKMLFPIAAMTVLAGCGKGSSDAPLVDSNGKHPAGWIAMHGGVAAKSTSACGECHGNDQAGGISRVSCMSALPMSGVTCHASSPVANSTPCLSCHGLPPNGAAAPNRAGAHAKHLALAGITCATCHSGAGFGTANHAKANAAGGIADATVSPLSASFQAKTFTSFGYDASSKSCSGIICHGGVPTPQWYSSAAIGCLDCHTQGTSPQVPQFNSFYSGSISVNSGLNSVNLHRIHLTETVPGASRLVVCTDCHNTAALALQHFTGLTTPAFEATAGGSIGGGSTRILSYTPYTASVPSGNCTSSCHGNEFWVSP